MVTRFPHSQGRWGSASRIRTGKDHDGVDYAEVARRALVVVDTRNALPRVAGEYIFRR